MRYVCSRAQASIKRFPLDIPNVVQSSGLNLMNHWLHGAHVPFNLATLPDQARLVTAPCRTQQDLPASLLHLSPGIACKACNSVRARVMTLIDLLAGQSL